jgi:hypothetical protein
MIIKISELNRRINTKNSSYRPSSPMKALMLEWVICLVGTAEMEKCSIPHVL